MNVSDLLESARTIAVVGCSPIPSHTSHYIAKYLIRAGYDVIPVNPYHAELLGRKCYPDVSSIPHDVEIDIVNVFRRSHFTADTVRDVARRAEQTGKRPVIWTQIGVHAPEAQALAEASDLPYVANRCIMVDHGRVAV